MSWELDRVVGLMTEAAAIAREARKGLRRELKSDRSLVTQADRGIETLFADALERPSEGTYFIGEETLATKGEDYIRAALSADETFIVDPIDGTIPYALGLPNWGVSIGRMVAGEIVDGAVYLVDYNELVISQGDTLLEGRFEGGDWSWRELPQPEPSSMQLAPVALTQVVAKRGHVDLPHPAMVLGAAVVPVVGLAQGRFAAYLGSVKLWDIAGALPLALRAGFRGSVVVDGKERPLTPRVSSDTYHLDPQDRKRWALRSNLLLCRPDDEERMRAAFTFK